MRFTPKPQGAARPALDPKEVRKLFDYNMETGEFRWRDTGASAGSVYSSGYTVVMVKYRAYPAHRLIWAWMKGQWPTAHMDHVNRDRSDNRWCNLREATRAQNQQNRPGHGRTGIKGVSFCNREQRFVASIQVNGKRKHLGYFDTAEAAGEAYVAAAKLYHGDFACTAHRTQVEGVSAASG